MSNHDDTKHDKIRESWIESLLISASKPQDNSERLARAMRQIDAVDQNTRGAPQLSAGSGSRTRLLRWPTFGVAATIASHELLPLLSSDVQRFLTSISPLTLVIPLLVHWDAKPCRPFPTYRNLASPDYISIQKTLIRSIHGCIRAQC